MSVSTASPSLGKPASLLASLALAALPAVAAERASLPVYLADNHAETFGWIARVLDLDAPHTLVLVDAHSDASAAERSEEIREQVRRVASLDERAARIEDWRAGGRLQAYNWLEPLMPRPVERVLWIPQPELNALEARLRTRKAVSQLDGRLEVEPRSAGSFAGRWETRDLAGLLDWKPGEKTAVVLSLDLDFFAGMDAASREARFAAIWTRAMDWPGLRGVACSVSRPWLRDEAEAETLVSLLVDAVVRTPQARLEIDASLDDRPDRSRRAGEFPEGGVPRWDLAQAGSALRLRLLGLGPRLVLADRGRDWLPILADWEAETPPASIRPESGEIDLDEVWRFPLGAEPVLRLVPPPGATGRVRWSRLEPARPAYDLVPETGLGKDFADSPARWIHEIPTPLGETTDFLLAPATWRSESPGRIRIGAEYETARGWLAAAPVELRMCQGEGFRAALSECFGMPYVFGIAFAREGDLSGVETGWGADCSNLMIHAWRRQGLPLAWGDPGMLRRQLVTKVERAGPDDGIAISPAEIEAGLLVDFGRHVAAVWEDREPIGRLDGSDLLVHHLGGFPEIATLAELAADRPVFAVRLPGPGSGVRLALAGDVVLAGEDSVAIPGFGRGDADLFFANLEGIPSLLEPETMPRYDFRFPPERLAFLREHGLDAVSLANNHALDAGPRGLVEGLDALRSIGLPVVGAGRNEAEACRPWRVERGGVGIAVFGVSLLPGDEAGPEAPGVANLPRHGVLLAAELAEARRRGERVVVLVHGGDEYRREVNEDQRRWARWLVARGAEVVAGAHPHVLQREERHAGAIVLHSLGNAVYPRELKGADSGEVRAVELP
jgi:hypothetical protein